MGVKGGKGSKVEGCVREESRASRTWRKGREYSFKTGRGRGRGLTWQMREFIGVWQ